MEGSRIPLCRICIHGRRTCRISGALTIRDTTLLLGGLDDDDVHEVNQ